MTTLTASVTIGDRFAADSGRFPMSGVQALIRLIVDVRRADRAQGLETAAFVSGYEGSPLAGLDLELQRREQLLAEHDIVFRPAVNEELAATAVQGAQLVAGHADARVAGITGFWYGKSPGVDRASDALRHANLIGTHPNGGAVAFVGDDPAAKSSTVPGASEYLLADLGMPVLYPADPQDVVDLGRHAVAMSRASGLWVALKIVATVADGVGLVEIGPGRVEPAADLGLTYTHQPNARMLQPGLSEMERSREGIRREVVIAYARANGVNQVENFGAAPRTGIVAGGKTYLELRQALRIIGLDEAGLSSRGMRLLHLGMIHPLVPDQIEEFAAGLDEIIVVEEKRPFVESAIKHILYGRPDAPRVTGRGHAGPPLFPAEGELDADLIAAGLAERLGDHRTAKPRAVTQLPLVARTPYFCSGCPHNTSTKVPAGSMVGGGIGCHALVLMMEPDAVGEVTGLTQMGGEGSQWIGMEPFLRTRKHLLQNIGDGTFHHSGSLAVRAAIASGASITFKLLYNSAVAMTGGQDAVGAMAVPALTRALAAEGVRRIIVTTGEPGQYRRRQYRRQHGPLASIAEVWPRDRLAEAQETLSKISGVTVLIHDQECATELRRKRKRGLAPEPPQRVMINERVCEGCGDCGQQSNCLSVQPADTDFGRKTTIDQSSCNKDFSCLAGDCPSFVEVRPAAGRRQHRRTAPSLKSEDLPEPVARFNLDTDPQAPHTTRITGVGGTGIVTVSQILAAAAGFAGREVRTLDQIGLAQKGGAVVSDVKISASPLPVASKAAAGECDLYLGCDLLVAADPKNLAVADAARTVAVVSTTKVPTGRMVTDPGSAFPDVDVIADRIRVAAGGRDPVLLDARRVAVTLLGTDQYANMLLVGAAYQTGALPLPAEAIEQAIGLNGVAVDANLQAFRRGRQAVADPAAFAGAVATLAVSPPARPRNEPAERLAEQVGAPAGSELDRLVRDRTADLVSYQNLGYADAYAGLVRRVYEAERAAAPASTALSEQVARYLYKLMAYKDEYEVARLSLDPQLIAMVEAEFGPGATVSYRLHPPVLRALGLHRKLRLGPWFRPVFRLLRAMKVLRGTPLDPFGRTRVRRLERELITEYRAAIEDLLANLTEHTLPDCARIAALPDQVRGYEQIKITSAARYRTELQTALAGLRA
jgi:indolepyruvate ferredoxin oxidoreductase